jgi:hypothetical protein
MSEITLLAEVTAFYASRTGSLLPVSEAAAARRLR